jgi:hypothetical protein
VEFPPFALLQYNRVLIRDISTVVVLRICVPGLLTVIVIPASLGAVLGDGDMACGPWGGGDSIAEEVLD